MLVPQEHILERTQVLSPVTFSCMFTLSLCPASVFILALLFDLNLWLWEVLRCLPLNFLSSVFSNLCAKDLVKCCFYFGFVWEILRAYLDTQVLTDPSLCSQIKLGKALGNRWGTGDQTQVICVQDKQTLLPLNLSVNILMALLFQ